MTFPGTPPANNIPLPDISAKEFILWLLRLRRRFRVRGASMLPLLKPGDEVLINPNAYRRHPPQIGDIVVANHPLTPDVEIIKRIAAPGKNGYYHLQGDNPAASTDSRAFGPISRHQITGKVTCRFS